MSATAVAGFDASENNGTEERPMDKKSDGIFQIFILPYCMLTDSLVKQFCLSSSSVTQPISWVLILLKLEN